MSTCISIFNNIIYNSGYLGSLVCTGNFDVYGNCTVGNYFTAAEAEISGTVTAGDLYATGGLHSNVLHLHDFIEIGETQPVISGGSTGSMISLIELIGSYTNPFGGFGTPSNNELQVRIRGDVEITGDTVSFGPVTSRSSGNFIGGIKCDFLEATGISGSSFNGPLSAYSSVSTPSCYVSENLEATEIYSSVVVTMDSSTSPTSYYSLLAPANQDARGIYFPVITEPSGTLAVSQTQSTGSTPGVEILQFSNGRKIIWFEDSTPELFSAPPGSLYINTESNASTGTALYIKATGTGGAGWRNIA